MVMGGSLPQGCPKCKSLAGIVRKDAVTCFAGRAKVSGVCIQCLDCGVVFYAMRNGQVAVVGGSQRQLVVREDQRDSVPEPEQRRAPIGLEDARLAPAE